MYRTPDNEQLVLHLKDGIRWEEKPSQQNPSDYRRQLIRFRFAETEQRFSLKSFDMHRSTQADWKSTIQMMNLKQLDSNQAVKRRQTDSSVMSNFLILKGYYRYFTFSHKIIKGKVMAPATKDVLAGLDKNGKLAAVSGALTEAKSINIAITPRVDGFKEASKDIRKYSIEYQKKFTLSAACLVLFFVGAPLGAIIRKGGLGMPVVVAVIFFLVYYIIATIGEKSAKEGDLSPVVGMWISIVVLTPMGLFLSYKAATDSALFDIDVYRRFFIKLSKHFKLKRAT